MRVLVTFSILGVLALSGCSRNSSTAASKTDTEQAIKAKMAAEPELARAITIDVNPDKNEIVLTGTVPTEGLRTQAVQIAKLSREGVVVTDKIDVKPRELTRNDYTPDMAREQREKAKASGEKVGDSIDDAWIHTKITSKLVASPQTPARKINVDVVKGDVTLRGQVENAAAKEEAERIAKDTEGVKRVRNLLKVVAG